MSERQLDISKRTAKIWTMTQNEYIYDLLIKRPINSFERFNGGLYAGQLPRCIWDLENKPQWNLKGKIKHLDNKDGSTTYILLTKSNPIVKGHPKPEVWNYTKDGVAYRVKEDPEQLHI